MAESSSAEPSIPNTSQLAELDKAQADYDILQKAFYKKGREVGFTKDEMDMLHDQTHELMFGEDKPVEIENDPYRILTCIEINNERPDLKPINYDGVLAPCVANIVFEDEPEKFAINVCKIVIEICCTQLNENVFQTAYGQYSETTQSLRRILINSVVNLKKRHGFPSIGHPTVEVIGAEHPSTSSPAEKFPQGDPPHLDSKKPQKCLSKKRMKRIRNAGSNSKKADQISSGNGKKPPPKRVSTKLDYDVQHIVRHPLLVLDALLKEMDKEENKEFVASVPDLWLHMFKNMHACVMDTVQNLTIYILDERRVTGDKVNLIIFTIAYIVNKKFILDGMKSFPELITYERFGNNAKNIELSMTSYLMNGVQELSNIISAISKEIGGCLCGNECFRTFKPKV